MRGPKMPLVVYQGALLAGLVSILGFLVALYLVENVLHFHILSVAGRPAKLAALFAFAVGSLAALQYLGAFENPQLYLALYRRTWAIGAAMLFAMITPMFM